MNKIWLVIKREYLTRVRNKTFLLSTFLFPLILILFIVGSVFLAVRTREKVKIAVADKNGIYQSTLKSDSSSVIFSFDKSVDSNNYREKKFAGILYIPDDTNSLNYSIISHKQIGIEVKEIIKRLLNKANENRILQQKGIDNQLLDSISKVSADAISLINKLKDKEGNVKEANSGLAYGIGFGSGILIYITMFIFGAMVMRGVMEEKTNRIAEVMVSSIKPFQLMMGKIIGIAGVGLTQFLLWIGLILVLFNVVGLFLPGDTLQQMQQVNDAQQGLPGGANNTAALKFLQAKNNFASANWFLIISCFLFYFLGGYLFYASLFAAIGSVVNEDPQEAQSLMLPITMPIIFSFIILSTSVTNPNNSAMVWGSMIPFSSPILMMGRIAYGVPEGVPVWQLLLSMALLVCGFIFTTWFAGKVYRTGILLYGKKATWKEMIKWIRKS
jgi:ABC-2 type transport system permease protein